MYLLDTHVVLWWLTDPEKLSAEGCKVISDRSNAIFVSSISLWEMTIKSSIGKLNMPNNILDLLKAEGFKILPLFAEEGLYVANLPSLHQDPFDRVLIAQAKYNNFTLLTRDEKIQQYPVATLLT